MFTMFTAEQANKQTQQFQENLRLKTKAEAENFITKNIENLLKETSAQGKHQITVKNIPFELVVITKAILESFNYHCVVEEPGVLTIKW